MYLPVKAKFTVSVVYAVLWSIFSFYIAEKWTSDLAEYVGFTVAYLIIFGIAIIPGFMNAFLVMSLLLDKRPKRKEAEISYPPITVLVAGYNEEESIASTLESIHRQDYQNNIRVIFINDGSSDKTLDIAQECAKKYKWLEIINIEKNAGKANALNVALREVSTDLVITIDADSYLYKDAIKNLVGRMLSDPDHTAAVAGAVLVRNSRVNFVTKLQEWDYFHGIAAIKRIQALYQGTLVAQGAFSIYKTDVVKMTGGWPHCVGEDIVLTWAILRAGYRVGYAEDACLFTNAPTSWKQFFKQRQRWSRGLIEAFKEHSSLLTHARMTTLFIWWNVLFPYLDLVYTLAFLPGIILALFGIYLIAGPMTLIVLPMALIINYQIFRIQNKMFEEQGLRVRKNVLGFIGYSLFYSLILQPACVWGYLKEFFAGSVKNWGTK